MPQSTLTDKGQTTVPRAVRAALKVKPRQQLEWIVRADGTAVVRAQPNAVELFGSLKPAKSFPGFKAEKEAVSRAVAAHAAQEGLK